MPQTARVALVLMMQDILSVFPKALSRLPSSPQVMKCQRAVTVLMSTLKELEALL